MNKFFRFFILLLAIIFSASCGHLIQPTIKSDIVLLKPGNYILDKDHATLLFKVNHMGFSHYIGRFNHFDAKLNFNPDDITASELEATVDMASVDVNNQDFEETLRSRFWLDTESFPQAFFKSTEVVKTSANSADFLGDLTFLGVSKPIKLTVIFNGGGLNKINARYTIGFRVDASFKRSEFGLDNYIPAVGDDITLEAHAEFYRQ